jgi:hypothetical protein
MLRAVAPKVPDVFIARELDWIQSKHKVDKPAFARDGIIFVLIRRIGAVRQEQCPSSRVFLL